MARIIKNNFGNFLVILLIFGLVTTWVFSGRPQIWKNPPFPPKIQEAQAAAPTVISKGTASDTTTTTVTPGYPASPQTNDIIWCLVVSAQPTTPISGTFTGWPSGWTVIAEGNYTNSSAVQVGRAALAWKRSDSTESGTFTLTRTGDTGTDSQFHAQMYLVRGAAITGNPYDAVTARYGPGNATVTWDAVTVSGLERTLLAFVGQNDNTPGVGNITGYTQTTTIDVATSGSDTQLRLQEEVNVSSDGSVTAANGETLGWATFHVSVKPGNSAPTVTNVSLNAGSSFSPVENTTRAVDVTGKVIDTDGCSDVQVPAALVFRSGVSITCSSNDNNCYRGITCSTSCSGSTEVLATCTSNIWFHADPTDYGVYSAEEWVGAILATDSANNTAQATNEAIENVDIIGTLCLDVTTSVAYGTVAAGTNSGSTNQITLITNTCNTAIDVLVSGTDMTSAAATGTIVVGNQHYDLTAFTYGGTETVLTGSNVLVEIVCAKPTSHAPSNSSDEVFWGIAVTAGTPIGTDYGGANTFTATND